MHKIWIDTPLLPEAMADLYREAAAILPEARNPDDPFDQIEEAHALILGSLFPGTRQNLARASKALVTARSGIGVDNIDVEAATDLGICVINTPDTPTEAVAEIVMGLMIDLARKITFLNNRMARGIWDDGSIRIGMLLRDKTLGLLGLGRIGGRMAELARAIHMKVLAFDPFIDPARAQALDVRLVSSVDDILEKADIVSIHVPLMESTRGSVGKDAFTKMKQGSYLINVSRGPIVVETELYEALESGHLAGAALDVWDPEPPRPDNPLLQLDNVIATPHAAGATLESRIQGNTEAVRQVLMILRGEKPEFLVNPEVWEERRKV